jgi:hypothetical protein
MYIIRCTRLNITYLGIKQSIFTDNPSLDHGLNYTGWGILKTQNPLYLLIKYSSKHYIY